MTQRWSLHPATAADAEWLADLKAQVMRPDLERLGYWDRDWARRRFLDTYVPANTDVIEINGKNIGSIAVRPEATAQWIEHFYLDPSAQGQGIGREVLDHAMRTHADARPFRLAVNRGSAARRLYERHGFTYTYDDQNGIDLIFTAPGPSVDNN